MKKWIIIPALAGAVAIGGVAWRAIRNRPADKVKLRKIL